MKKYLFLLITLLALNSLTANPVDVNEAKVLGEKFVGVHFKTQNRGLDLSLAYTAHYDRGEACFYVFNVGEAGFIILSSDDFYRPIIGYSENGKFDIDNIPPALQAYLDGIVMGRSRDRSDVNSAAPDVAADWRMLEKTGRLVSRNGGRGRDYLVQTTWDQAYPYNYYCPEDPAGSHGHTYVGCLATSMAQLVAFWAYPEHGTGYHCYYHPDYGTICADFENTYYDWEHMANKLSDASPIEEIEAVAMISFHCGVAIDMGYGPDGSGGASDPIVTAMPTYFSFCNNILHLSRQDYDMEPWCDMVKEQFDMDWPMYYGGCADGGCHAFICDGYDDYDMYHFNLGWNGSSDGWYIMDTAPYTEVSDAMFNFVPQYVYDATPSAPTNLVVTPSSDTSFEATLHWTNPTTYLNGASMTNIDKIIIMRNGNVCHEITEGIVAGEEMSYTDHVPYYDSYEYKVLAVSNGRKGRQALQKHVTFGPTCDWRVVMTTTNFTGWKGNHISIYNMANTEIAQLTLTSSAPQAIHIDVPVGRVKFAWTRSNDTIDNLSFNVYNSENTSIFSYSGSSIGLDEGVFCEYNNGCGNSGTCDSPANLEGVADGSDILLIWDGFLNAAYAFVVYRDEQIYKMITDNSEPFIDNDTDGAGHCYNVSILCENGESALSNMTCVSVGEGCDPATNLWYYIQESGKPVITWDTPENNENLTGYYVYRKCNDGEYKRVKILAANKNEYKENSPIEMGNWYSYKVLAYYQNIDCYSIPAKARYGNAYCVRIFYSPEDISENVAKNVAIYPNPANGLLTVKADNLTNVMVYNALGQKVLEQSIDADEISISTTDFDPGIYLIRIVANGNVITRRVSVMK